MSRDEKIVSTEDLLIDLHAAVREARSPPSASLGSGGVTATLYKDHLTLSDGNEDVTLTMEEVEDLLRFMLPHYCACCKG